MGGLEKIRGDENLMHGISGLINAMKELSRLAAKYSLEQELYHPMGGLGKVKVLIGASRYKKFLRTYRDVCLGNKDEWVGMYQFLQVELKDVQRYVISEKASQPLSPVKPEMPSKRKSDKNSEGT